MKLFFRTCMSQSWVPAFNPFWYGNWELSFLDFLYQEASQGGVGTAWSGDHSPQLATWETDAEAMMICFYRHWVKNSINTIPWLGDGEEDPPTYTGQPIAHHTETMGFPVKAAKKAMLLHLSDLCQVNRESGAQTTYGHTFSISF